MNELKPTNHFGELLLDLIESQYDGDIDAGIQALVESTGLSEEEVVAIIQGHHIVEDENLLSAIVDAFPDASEDDLDVMINVADHVDKADREELEARIAQDEMQDGAPDEDPEKDAEYSRHMNTANFVASKVQELDDKIASFEYTNAVNNELRALDMLATQYVDAQRLPPSYKQLLIGNFSSDAQRVAKFGQIAQQNGVDVPTMLFATRYALGLLTDASDFVEFRDYSATDEDVAIANFSANLDHLVNEDLRAIFGE